MSPDYPVPTAPNTLGGETLDLARNICLMLENDTNVLQNFRNDLIGEPGIEPAKQETVTPAGLLPMLSSVLKSIHSEVSKQQSIINSLRNSI